MLKKNTFLNSTIIIIFLISLATISYFAYIKTKNNTENNLAKIENFNKTLNIILMLAKIKLFYQKNLKDYIKLII